MRKRERQQPWGSTSWMELLLGSFLFGWTEGLAKKGPESHRLPSPVNVGQ